MVRLKQKQKKFQHDVVDITVPISGRFCLAGFVRLARVFTKVKFDSFLYVYELTGLLDNTSIALHLPNITPIRPLQSSFRLAQNCRTDRSLRVRKAMRKAKKTC